MSPLHWIRYPRYVPGHALGPWPNPNQCSSCNVLDSFPSHRDGLKAEIWFQFESLVDFQMTNQKVQDESQDCDENNGSAKQRLFLFRWQYFLQLLSFLSKDTLVRTVWSILYEPDRTDWIFQAWNHNFKIRYPDLRNISYSSIQESKVYHQFQYYP